MPHLTQDTIWESSKTQENITHKRAKRSALSQQVTTRLHKQIRQYDKDKQERQITKKIQRRSTALEGSVRKLLEGLNLVNGTNPTLSSDVDRNRYAKVTKTQENTAQKRSKRSVLSQQVPTRLQGTKWT